ncbi:MAG: 4-(cytidine 5'-diphospho)-2-C-methyl-D-erythritol kinase, partial [Pelosinus sp.]|nr:4-(cytidine 5'-diphospho)-2-C-methyl-D-erythritol kinase [Pelosinus sp.]
YHEVAMVMQTVSLADKVTVEQFGDISVSTNTLELACDESNLAYKAAKLVKETYGIKKGAKIVLEKHIPMAAGLAGGSADAAAVLRAVNKLWSLNLPLEELERLGAMLGSDVPFCLRGGTMLATGRGEILTPLSPLPECYLILAKPRISVSTAWVYQHYNAGKVQCHPDTTAMCSCLAQKDVQGVVKKMCNVLESVTIPEYPQIARLKQQLTAQGAIASMMSGSGPTVFGVMPDKNTAQAALEKLRLEYKDSVEVFVAKTIQGVE